MSASVVKIFMLDVCEQSSDNIFLILYVFSVFIFSSLLTRCSVSICTYSTNPKYWDGQLEQTVLTYLRC